jgi:hypothetical protein
MNPPLGEGPSVQTSLVVLDGFVGIAPRGAWLCMGVFYGEGTAVLLLF